MTVLQIGYSVDGCFSLDEQGDADVGRCGRRSNCEQRARYV